MSELLDVGVTEDGFLNTTRDVIYNKIADRLKASFGNQFDTSQESPDGQFIAVVSDLSKQLLDIIEEAYYSYSPTHAYGQGLANIIALNRIQRFINTATKVTVYLEGVAGTIVPAGSQVGTISGAELTITEEVTIPYAVTAICNETGEVYIGPNEVTEILTPVTGWDTVNNPNEGQTGVTYETDPKLRARRENSTILTGNGPLDAIYEGLFEMGLEFISIVENDTAEDIDGQPSGTFQVIVDGGAESEIAKVISSYKALGARTYGNVQVTIKDSKGYDKVINFSRSAGAEIFVDVDIKRLKGSTNDSGTVVQKVIIDYLNSLNIGEPIYWSELIGEITDKTDLISVRNLTLGRVQDATMSTDDLEVLRNEKPLGTITGVRVNVLPESFAARAAK